MPGSYTFETSAIAFEGALSIDDAGARLDTSPTVGIDQAPDGSGTISVSQDNRLRLLPRIPRAPIARMRVSR